MTTKLSVAARNTLEQYAPLAALGLVGADPGASPEWPLWIFADDPQRVVENSQKCAIVILEGSPWTSPNEHNTERFPTLIVDIWADPTRNADRSVRIYDADDKILQVVSVINSVLHTVNSSVPRNAPAWMGPAGSSRMWGTASQIATRTGVQIFNSHQASGPDFSPMRETTGGRMGRVVYNVSTL